VPRSVGREEKTDPRDVLVRPAKQVCRDAFGKKKGGEVLPIPPPIPRWGGGGKKREGGGEGKKRGKREQPRHTSIYVDVPVQKKGGEGSVLKRKGETRTEKGDTKLVRLHLLSTKRKKREGN